MSKSKFQKERKTKNLSRSRFKQDLHLWGVTEIKKKNVKIKQFLEKRDFIENAKKTALHPFQNYKHSHYEYFKRFLDKRRQQCQTKSVLYWRTTE